MNRTDDKILTADIAGGRFRNFISFPGLCFRLVLGVVLVSHVSRYVEWVLNVLYSICQYLFITLFM